MRQFTTAGANGVITKAKWMFRFKLLIAMTILFSTGCATHYIYPEVELTQPPVGFNNIVVGAEKSGNIDYGWGGEPTPPTDLQSLVTALNANKVFKATSFIKDLPDSPNIIISHYKDSSVEFRGLHGEKGGFFCNIYLSIMTLFVVPWYCSSEEVVEFRVTNTLSEKSELVTFNRYQKHMLGWFSFLTLLNPSWSTDQLEANREYERNYLNFAINQVINSSDTIIRIANE